MHVRNPRNPKVRTRPRRSRGPLSCTPRHRVASPSGRFSRCHRCCGSCGQRGVPAGQHAWRRVDNPVVRMWAATPGLLTASQCSHRVHGEVSGCPPDPPSCPQPSTGNCGQNPRNAVTAPPGQRWTCFVHRFAHTQWTVRTANVEKAVDNSHLPVGTRTLWEGTTAQRDCCLIRPVSSVTLL